MKVNKNDPILFWVFGFLEKLTILAIILKLFNILQFNWSIILLPLWASLIFGGLLGLYWFFIELIQTIKEKNNE